MEESVVESDCKYKNFKGEQKDFVESAVHDLKVRVRALFIPLQDVGY